MLILMKVLGLVLPFLAGCFVVQDEPTSSAELTVEVTPEVEEVNYVVYREYFGCTEQEIAYFPHYRRYYRLTDEDIYFIYFTSRQCDVSFDLCFHSFYYDCDRNYDRLVVYYHVPRERYFVAIGAGVSPPPMYARTYASYRSGHTASVTFTNQEYVALVDLKVGVEYQGHPPATFFDRVQATGSTRRVIVESRDQSGRGGKTAAGTKLTATAPRPWTMPPQQKQQWHQERQASVAKTEATFKEVHKEQVHKVEQQKSATPPKPVPQGPEHKSAPGNPPPQAPGEPRPTDPKRPHAQEPPRPEDRPHVQEPKGPPDRPSGHQVPPEPPKKTEKPPPKPPQHEPPEEKPKGDEKGGKKDKGDGLEK